MDILYTYTIIPYEICFHVFSFGPFHREQLSIVLKELRLQFNTECYYCEDNDLRRCRTIFNKKSLCSRCWPIGKI